MELIHDLQGFLDTIKLIGGDARTLRADPPATEAEVAAVEHRLSTAIPAELRTAMRTVSAHLEFKWFLKKAVVLPPALRSIFCGEIHWGLDLTPAFLATYHNWIDKVFPNPEDPYDVIWHNKFPFLEVGNGDFISIASDGRIVYLSHDDGEGHGYVMADSLSDLLQRWVPLGCAGGDDWQWLPFTNGRTTRIDPACEAAHVWKSILGRNN
jgi:hypothetical protein